MLNQLDQLHRVLAPGAAQHGDIIQHRKAAAAEKLLHHDLVHRDGAAADACGRVGNIHQFKQTLQASVLPVKAVHHRDHAVKPGRYIKPAATRQPALGIAKQRA
ncbi:hypothetical protein SDC9_130598 [bioreactor metagenome]|uniref:Uncharacterized protein n=1 Tax=bioreactor metagenome TaxID=1076179 RepID=A0A645D2L7_9ZZZZ